MISTTDYYAWLGSPERRAELKAAVEREGYDAFRALVDQLAAALKRCDETEFDELAARIAAGAELFPEPVRFSPTWQNVWDELSAKLRWKRFAFESVPPAEREGEWQIILDNPYTTQEIVCYPSLSFLEAAYLFGYFKPTLVSNEYLRLQKVVTAIVQSGD